MKRLIGFLIVVSLIMVAGTAFAAEFKVGGRYFQKFLDRNTMDPSKYATTGNGVSARGELQLNLEGRLSDQCEMGARILTVWDPNYNIDTSVTSTGRTGLVTIEGGLLWDTTDPLNPTIIPDRRISMTTEVTGDVKQTLIESNYSDWWGWYSGYGNLWQVRGIWTRFYPKTIPTLKSVLIGSTDLGMFSPWTIGMIRFIDRDNARIIYAAGEIGKAQYGVGWFPQPAWWAPSNWSTGPNPRRAGTYGAFLTLAPNQALNFKLTAAHSQAMQQDPAVPLTVDDNKPVVRFDNAVEALEINFQPNTVYTINGLIAMSNYSPNTDIYGAPQAWWSHFPYADNVTGNAMKLTAAASDPLGIGLTVKGEYFNVGTDYVALMAARRESRVLLTEGYVRYNAGTPGSTWAGRVDYEPSIIPDNDSLDWNEIYAKSCVGLNGITIMPEFRSGALGIKGEVTTMTNGYNSQNIDLNKYPWFAAYPPAFPDARTKMDESSMLGAIRVDYLIPFRNGLNVFAKYKLYDYTDGVDTTIATDNKSSNDVEIYAGATYQLTDEIGLTGGYKTMAYVDKGNGTDQHVKMADYSLGMVFAEVKSNVGGADMSLAYERVNGDEKVGATKVSDMRMIATVAVKI